MEPAYRWPENGVRPGTDSENSICINKKVVLTYIINLLYILFYVTGEGGGVHNLATVRIRPHVYVNFCVHEEIISDSYAH